jgi:hypothetical protein
MTPLTTKSGGMCFFQRLREHAGTKSPAPPTAQPRLSLPAVARLNIKSGARAGVDPREFCFKEGLAGMGWPVETDQKTPLTWELYQQCAMATYGGISWQPVVGLHDLPDRAVIWSRSGYGRNTRFWAGLVVGPWQYRDDHETRNADIENVRPVLWYEVGGYETVPPAIARAFTPATFAHIKQDEAIVFTQMLAARLVAEGVWPA